MFPKYLAPSRICGKRSSALVITLAILVLICAILLEFLEQSSLNRQISFSSAGQDRADLLAHTALDTITGDLRTEIAAGSTTYTSNNISIYIPTTNFTVVPCQVDNQGLLNLVKQSASASNCWTGSFYHSSIASPIRSAANNSTQIPSANGRYIEINEWNKLGLLGDPGAGTTPTIPKTYTTPPDWVLITRNGAVTNANILPAVGPGVGTLSDRTASNANYVIGRYAYAIYDEGGLLDINVAGYPSSVSGTDFTTKRGLLPQVDLANIPGINTDANANALVQWRNQTTAASAASYTNYVFTNTNGFTTVAPGDQTFVSRQDLINYVRANPNQISTSALQYLGTFTREQNAPSYTPPPVGSVTRPPDAAVLGQDDAFNPSSVNIRVTTPFIRDSDNTTANAGEPLIKYRFPLSRLIWIGHTGPNGATAAQIYNSFGLTWSTSIVDSWSGSTTSGWVYNHGSTPNGHGNGQTILLLSDVATLGREPDFFELLQAGILLGSLGKTSANAYSTIGALDTNTYLQIIQIGANLIDQSKSDAYPTHISFDNTDLYGIENLPYLTRVYDTPYRFNGPGQPSNVPNAGVWYQPEVWNPHAQAASPPAGPTQFRFITTGAAYAYFFGVGASYSSINSFSNPTGITFSTSAGNTFSAPTLLSPSVGAAASGNDYVTDGGLVNFVGIWVGTANAPDQRIDSTYPNTFTWSEAMPNPLVTHQLQYLDGGKWITYDVMRNINTGAGDLDSSVPNCFRTYFPAVFMIRPDPSTDRFGPVAAAGTPNYVINETIRPNAGIGYEAHGNLASTGWSFAGTQLYPGLAISAYLGTLSDNLTTSATYYADPDTVLRAGDGAYTDGTVADGGYPLATDSFNSASSRPIILNRPFRSVADMGYASRGMPWKHLDFFTAQSGDAALLDLFCVYEPAVAVASSSSSSPPPEAGRLDLNTRQQPVLTAILTGAVKSDTDGTTITSAEAAGLATSLTNITSNQTQGPLLNRAELATRMAPILTYSSAPDTIIKRRREAAIRSLADIGNTRTWNLLIDVIAQSGRYASLATNLNQFSVEGERHYWLHVAIDRFTGKVLQQYLEPVYE